MLFLKVKQRAFITFLQDDLTSIR